MFLELLYYNYKLLFSIILAHLTWFTFKELMWCYLIINIVAYV